MSIESIHREAFHLLAHEQIGSGMSRNVYSSKLMPDCVIKVEDAAAQFQNIVEWETWLRVRDTKFSRWFAACRWISPNGQVLIMERTAPAGPDDFPAKLPAFLCDFKRENYGLSMMPDPVTGQPAKAFVCHDYGTNLLFEHGMTKRMHEVKWWSE